MPGVNDTPEQVERILELAAEAGAVSAGGVALHLRGEVKELWFDWLREKRPDLIPLYERLYRRGAYAPPQERERLAKLARGDERFGHRPRMRASERAADPAAPLPAGRRQEAQESLF
jgi:DNA repair photolyase